jgi:hypothetical protein
MFDFNSILTNAAAYTSAKTASDSEVTAAYDEALELQKKRNARYDKFKKVLTDDGMDESDAEDYLADNGLAKVNITSAYKRNLKSQVKQALDAEKNAALKESLSEMKELAKEFAEIENQYTPKSSIDKYIELKMAQEFPSTAPAYQAPAYQAPVPSINPILAEKSRLNREKEERIAKLRQDKKRGYITALEMAQGIGELNSEYNSKIANLG